MSKKHLWLLLIALAAVMALSIGSALADPPLSGAIFTTDSTCTGVDLNIYADQSLVYLDGGPTKPGAAGLPDGNYYVQVTEPDGTQLGYSSTANATVTGGEFTTCYSLWNSLIKTSDGTTGYDTTSNPGGEYKVWVCQDNTYTPSTCKTDNFKVKGSINNPPPTARLTVEKFYDANVNGVYDSGDSLITGWKVNIQDDINIDRYTSVDITVDPDTYTVTEYSPLETNWLHTTATSDGPFVLAANTTHDTMFGNVCTGAGGGLTLGYYSNKNGQATVTSTDLTFLDSLNLVNANGTAFDPASPKALATWLLNATATNMANMLSAQLATMELSVRHGLVNGSSLIYAPGTSSANTLGFATVNTVMSEGNTLLGSPGGNLTTAMSSLRTAEESVKNALDRANNNLNFVQSSPCAFSFAP